MASKNGPIPVLGYWSALEDSCNDIGQARTANEGYTSVAEQTKLSLREDSEVEEQQRYFIESDNHFVHDLGNVKPLKAIVSIFNGKVLRGI
jgi:hypothetical protein